MGCEVSANAVDPNDIVAGPDGAMWFTQSAGGNPKGGQSYFPASIGRLTTTGSYSSYPVPASASSVPGLDAITVGPNGNLWFTEAAVNRIGEITPKASGPVVHEFALPAADRLAPGVGSPVTSAETIAPGPGGDIWFTEQGSNAIGVMSTSGALLSQVHRAQPKLGPVPSASPRAPTRPCGSPRTAPTESPASPPRGRSASTPCRRAPMGRRASSTGPTATCGSPTTARGGQDRHEHRQGHALLGAQRPPGPAGVTVGPDCTSVWFTDPGAGRLGRLSPVPNTTGCKAGAVPAP